MVELFIACRKQKTVVVKEKEVKVSTTDRATFSPSTTHLPTFKTTMYEEPEECRGATNLTEDWRQDHYGSKLYPGLPNCDTTKMISDGRQWFRFAGAAGSMMLNKCPPQYSCGTHGGIWTNDTMPIQVGVETNITAYVSLKTCIRYTVILSVMKCSNSLSNNFIYKYVDDFQYCSYGFCGMMSLD